MYKCCIEIITLMLIHYIKKVLHMYKCCIEMTYWNNQLMGKYLLHMYKCCIEICGVEPAFYDLYSSTCTNVVLKWSNMVFYAICSKLHMYKCCIEIKMVHTFSGNQVAPHVQMLYWNLVSFAKSTPIALGSTFTNVVLKWVCYGTHGFLYRAPHVQMLYWNFDSWSKSLCWVLLHMYKCCIEMHLHYMPW